MAEWIYWTQTKSDGSIVNYIYDDKWPYSGNKLQDQLNELE